jgi:hypothetical protein
VHDFSSNGSTKPTMRRFVAVILVVLGIVVYVNANVSIAFAGQLIVLVGIFCFTPELFSMTSRYGAFTRRTVALVFLCVAMYFLLKASNSTDRIERSAMGFSSMTNWLICAAFIIPDIVRFFGHCSTGFYMAAGEMPEPDYSLAKKAIMEGDFDAAVKHFREYIDADPLDQRVRYEMAQLYHKHVKNAELACYWYDKVTAYKRGSPLELTSFRQQIELLCQNGDTPSARLVHVNMNRIFSTNPGTSAAFNIIEDFELELQDDKV